MIVLLLTAVGLSPGGSSYFTCIQNMKLVTERYISALHHVFSHPYYLVRRSQWPRGLRSSSAAARPAEIVGSNPTGGMDVSLS